MGNVANRQFNIFVEGNDDHDLLLTLLLQRPELRLDPVRKAKRAATYLLFQEAGDSVFLQATGGWTNLPESSVQFQQAKDSGGRNLIVFDADYDERKYPDGGYLKRAAIIRQAVADFDANPALFLFPQPNEDGNLETLLLRLTQPQHQRVLDCYDGYEICLSQYQDASGKPSYNAPSNKRRVYDYVNVMPMTPKEEERHFDKGGQKLFENSSIWNLNSPAIQPLRDFLDQYLR